MKTQFRLIAKGINGKSYYFDTLQEIGNLFTIDEIKDSYITVILGAVVVGEIDVDLLANEVLFLRLFK